MVLVCNDPRFIFLKTTKTAGTSVERLFQNFCLPDGHDGKVQRTPVISDRGIVGARGSVGPGKELEGETAPLWWNHMPADAVEANLGREAFDAAFKFSTVRNPYRAVLSRYFFARRIAYPKNWVEFVFRRWKFRRWLLRQGNLAQLGNHEIVHIDGRFVLDDFIRQEHLKEDITRIAGTLGLPVDVAELGHDKRNAADAQRFPPAAYYDAATARHVQNAYEWCFEHCGYSRDVNDA